MDHQKDWIIQIEKGQNTETAADMFEAATSPSAAAAAVPDSIVAAVPGNIAAVPGNIAAALPSWLTVHLTVVQNCLTWQMDHWGQMGLLQDFQCRSQRLFAVSVPHLHKDYLAIACQNPQPVMKNTSNLALVAST